MKVKRPDLAEELLGLTKLDEPVNGVNQTVLKTQLYIKYGIKTECAVDKL